MTTAPFVVQWSKALATDRRLSSTDISVARALALFMSASGSTAHPTHGRLAFAARVGERTIRRSVSTLLRTGWILQVVHAAPGRAASYRAAIPVLDAQDTLIFTGEQRSPVTGEQRTPVSAVGGEHRSRVTGTPVTGVRPTIHEGSNIKNARLDEDFETAWLSYPRKVAKLASKRAYLARRRAGASADELLTATTHYAASVAGHDPRFVMHASTFFGPDERWRDHLEPPSAVSYDTAEVAYR